MKKNNWIFIVGLYIAICISISGYYYINPKITYNYSKTTLLDRYGEAKEFKHYSDVEIQKKKLINNEYIRNIEENISYKNFKYSLLFSVVGLVLLVSTIQLFKKKQT